MFPCFRGFRLLGDESRHPVPLCRRAASRGAISESAGNGRARYGSAPQSRSIRQSAPPGVSGHEKSRPEGRLRSRHAPDASAVQLGGHTPHPILLLPQSEGHAIYEHRSIPAKIRSKCSVVEPSISTGSETLTIVQSRRAIYFDRFRNFWCLWLTDSHVGKPRRFGRFRNTSSGILSSSLSANRVVSAGSETSAAIFAPWPGVLSWNRPKKQASRFNDLAPKGVLRGLRAREFPHPLRYFLPF